MRKDKIIRLAIIVLLTISLISGGYLINYYYTLNRGNKELDEIASIFNESIEDSDKEQINNNNQDDLKKEDKDNLSSEDLNDQKKKEDQLKKIQALLDLREENSDLAAWITIGGTKVNYPIMFTPEDPEFYLRRGFNKESSPGGVLFVDGRNNLEPRSDNIIIHGHNMRNGTMFADLLLYKDKSFLESHPTIEITTFDQVETYDIIAAFPASAYGDGENNFLFYGYTDGTKEEYNTYIKNIEEISLHDTGHKAVYGDKLITLSTCSYHTKEGRFVVIAKMRK